MAAIGAAASLFFVALVMATPGWPLASLIAIAGLLGLTSAGWNGIALAEIAPLAPVEQAGQEIPDNERLKVLPASSAVDGRSEPVFETSQQSFIGDVGPVVGALPVQERQSVAVSVISVGPGQHRKPLPPNAG